MRFFEGGKKKEKRERREDQKHHGMKFRRLQERKEESIEKK